MEIQNWGGGVVVVLVWFGFLFCLCFLGINVLCFVLSNKIQAVLLLLGA